MVNQLIETMAEEARKNNCCPYVECSFAIKCTEQCDWAKGQITNEGETA